MSFSYTWTNQFLSKKGIKSYILTLFLLSGKICMIQIQTMGNLVNYSSAYTIPIQSTALTISSSSPFLSRVNRDRVEWKVSSPQTLSIGEAFISRWPDRQWEGILGKIKIRSSSSLDFLIQAVDRSYPCKMIPCILGRVFWLILPSNQ